MHMLTCVSPPGEKQCSGQAPSTKDSHYNLQRLILSWSVLLGTVLGASAHPRQGFGGSVQCYRCPIVCVFCSVAAWSMYLPDYTQCS
jgi:hypothetical protein